MHAFGKFKNFIFVDFNFFIFAVKGKGGRNGVKQIHHIRQNKSYNHGTDNDVKKRYTRKYRKSQVKRNRYKVEF